MSYKAWLGPSGGLVPLVGYRGGTTRITLTHGGGVLPNQLSGFVHEPYIEYSFTTTDYTGDPYDVVAEATFTHTDTGTYTAPLYYSGSNTWKLRFTGPRVGYYTLSTTSTHSGLNGITGSADVQANPDATAKGYLTSSGIKHAYLTGDGNSLNTFLNNIYLRHSSATNPDGVEQISHLPIDSVARGAQIEALLTEIENHGMKSIFITGGHNWVQYPREYNQSSTNVYPDDTSFTIMEDLLQRAHDRGMFVHIWMWNDAGAGTASANLVGGINGSTDVRLQRYLVGRLGGYPNWELNYGYDLNEWVTEAQVQTWYSNMQSLSTIPRRYMARETEIGQVSDFTLGVNKLDVYAQDETDLPTGPYANAIDRFANATGKPMLYLRRFLHTRDGVWTMEVTRRAIWQFAMAGGAGGVYGVIWTTPVDYPNPEQLKHIGDFWEERFKFPLLVDSTPTDGYVLYEGDVRQVVYKENTNSIDITIPVGQVDVPVVSLNTVGGTYTEVNEGLYSAGTHTISLSSTSDWALSIGDFGLTIPDPAIQDSYDTVASSLGAVMIHNQSRDATTWFDESGNSLHGTLTSTPVWNATGGPGENIPGYFSFNGTSQIIQIANNALLQFTTAFTLVWWQRSDANAQENYAQIIGKGNEGYQVRLNSLDQTSMTSQVWDGSASYGDASTPTGYLTPFVNTWKMFMFRYDGSNSTLHTIDGSGNPEIVLTDAYALGPEVNTTRFVYAAQDDYGNLRRYWRGDLAGGLAFDTVLTTTQLKSLYDSAIGVGVTPPPSEGWITNQSVYYDTIVPSDVSADLFVDFDSGSDTNDGTSWAQAYATMEKAATDLDGVGGIVKVRGTRTIASEITITSSGASIGSRIEFWADSLYGAKVDANGATRAIQLNTDYVEINGFEIYDATYVGVRIYKTGDYQTTGAFHNRVRYCYIHDIRWPDNWATNGGAYISAHGPYTEVDSCFIKGSAPIAGDGFDTRMQGIYGRGSWLKITNNLVTNIRAGRGIQLYFSDTSLVIDCEVVGNTVLHCYDGGIQVQAENALVANNILAHNDGPGIRFFGSNSHATIENNLFHNNSTDVLDLSVNYTNTSVNGVSGDPGFVNYQADGTGDYKITSASPAFESASPTHATTRDYYGNIRESLPTIGFFEVEVVIPTPETPAYLSDPYYDSVVAFEGAMGYGANATGGRGNGTNGNTQLVFVDNLNDSGTGSLRAALTATGKRVIIPRVAGYVNLATEIIVDNTMGNFTFLGQLAPGGGLGVKPSVNPSWKMSLVTLNATPNVIMRYLSMRMGETRGDAPAHSSVGDYLGIGNGYYSSSKPLRISSVQDGIFDHISAAFGTDANIDIGGSTMERVTLQNSILTHPLALAGHYEGDHAFNTLNARGSNLSILYNLYANSKERNPDIGNYPKTQFIGNTIHNTQQGSFVYTGYSDQDTQAEIPAVDYRRNTHVAGPLNHPTDEDLRIRNISEVAGLTPKIYLEGNVSPDITDYSTIAGQKGIIRWFDPQTIGPDGTDVDDWVVTTSVDTPDIMLLDAGDAFNYVMANAGNNRTRDSLDTFAVNTAQGIGSSISSRPETVSGAGGYPTISINTYPTANSDGIPTSWRTAKGESRSWYELDTGGTGRMIIENYADDVAQGRYTP